MDAVEAKRPRELALEDGKLKRLLAEAHLDPHASKFTTGYNFVTSHSTSFSM